MLAVAAVAAAVLAPSANAAAGMVNPQIAGLQVALRAWGMYAGPIDGIAGPLTARGLHRFQRRMGLPAGVSDLRTRAKLGPLGRPLFGSRNLRRGDFGWDVSVLQFVLARAGLYHGAFTGYLDATTAAALRHYQRTAHLAVDGVAGPRTLASIAYRARVPVRPRPAATATASVIYIVRAGDSLTAIARRYHTSVRILARINHLDPTRVLLIGKHLRVPGAAPPASVPNASPQEVRALLDSWSTRLGVDTHLVRALAWMESGFQPKLVSSAGARGVLQLLPATKQYVATVILGKPLQPGVSGDVEAGVLLIKHLLGSFGGNEKLALAAWYQGERAVRTNGVYAVTKPFVSDVLALKARM